MRRLAALAGATLLVLAAVPAPNASASSSTVSVIIRHAPGAADEARRLVELSGGTVERPLPIIDGFAATVPAISAPRLAQLEPITAVTPNAPLQLLGRPDLRGDIDGRSYHDTDDRGRDADRDRRVLRGGDDDDRGDRDRRRWRQVDAPETPVRDDREAPQDRSDRDRDDDEAEDDDRDGRRDDQERDDPGRGGDDHGDDEGPRDDDGGPRDDDEGPRDDDEGPRDDDEGPRDDRDRDYEPRDMGSLGEAARLIGADHFWELGLTGAGVDVAVIDSGVTPVDGLDDPSKVVRGPDLSFESQAPNLRYLDTFGHGTFMAGLIAGGQTDGGYAGIAPGARLVSIKVADARGATDVSQVIAAIDWVIEHRTDAGLNIRVLNLSFGTYGAQPYTLDPLAFAAEAAWHSGVFVVVAAGNRAADATSLMNPAINPWVMAVGASDPVGTRGRGDDILLASSARGNAQRSPDVVAPGRSLHGLRVPGSYIDVTYPGGRINDALFRGSGTSQAAAIVSGAAALVIQQRPRIAPDELKALLTSTAFRLPNAGELGQGAGLVDLGRALRAPTMSRAQAWARSSGTGSLELARGSSHLIAHGVPLVGERDIFGAPFDSAQIAAATLAGTTWNGGIWNGSQWTGDGWVANEWSTVAWTGTGWSGHEWSASEWSGNEWSGHEWSGHEWSASEWSASEWSASEWSASEWSASEWSASEWSASEWSSEGWQVAEWSTAP